VELLIVDLTILTSHCTRFAVVV